MSFRVRMLSILDVVLRVPPIFVMDSILINCLGEITQITQFSYNSNNNNNNENVNYMTNNRKTFNNTSNNWKVSVTSINGSQLSVEDEEDVLSLSLTTSSIVWVIVYIHGIIDYRML